MKFEDIIDKSKQVKAPEFDQKKDSQKPNNMESFIEKLKKVDRKTRDSIRLLQGFYALMTCITLYYVISGTTPEMRIGLACIAAAFLVIIVVQQLRFIAYNYSYADRTMIQFIEDAKSRMKVFTKRTWLVIPIWIFLDIGICFIIYSELPYPNLIDDAILWLQVALVLLIALDFYVAHLVWKRDNKPVISEMDKIMEELES